MAPRPIPLDRWCATKIACEGPLSRESIERHQLAHLRALLAWAIERSPFYRQRLAGCNPHIESLDALAALPFTDAEDVRRNQPSLLCVSQSDISRVVTLQTSGTSGAVKRLYFTAEEQAATVDFFQHGMAQQTEPGDRVLILFPCARPGSIGTLLAEAVARLDATPITAGPIQDMAAALALFERERPTVVAGLPVQVRALARCTRLRRGAAAAVRSVLLSADPVSPRLARDIRDDWHCEVFEHYGMTEMGLGGAVACWAHQGGHLRENDLLVEIVDPISGRPLPEGERGEVVVTTLTRRGMPLIRYRTGDLSRLIPGRCRCGSPLRRLDRVTRVELAQLALQPGAVLTLDTLDQTLFAIAALTDYAVAWRPGPPPELRFALAHAPEEDFDHPAWLRRVEQALYRLPIIRAARAQTGLSLALSLTGSPLCDRPSKRAIERIAP
ncbi:MAG: phenylacetate--CoA ligase family protein [Paludibacterium sp.]|uniref:DVU_1553 family AMP-dependent CoA ligase n=1 Tax=Paludibacterium sp. TaxID=1917523 RepID=UPI0025CF5960|nr:AMP-binding protein [Paludibacterium sp.]MBV8047198.1 phenylacetate--CoA ligase family protein [Paludibacterium sp.]